MNSRLNPRFRGALVAKNVFAAASDAFPRVKTEERQKEAQREAFSGDAPEGLIFAPPTTFLTQNDSFYTCAGALSATKMQLNSDFKQITRSSAPCAFFTASKHVGMLHTEAFCNGVLPFA